MTRPEPSDDRGHWFELSGHSVHAPGLLVGVGVFSMLLTTLAIALNQGWFKGALSFSSDAILQHGEYWRAVSYALWNPPSLWFAVDMLMLWWFGRELEGYFGRRVFLKLFAGFVLVPSVCGTMLGWGLPLEWVGMPGNFSWFVAYATMAPGVSLLGGISAMWMAIVVLALQVLSSVAGHAWGELVQTLSQAGFAFGYVRWLQGRWVVPRVLENFTRSQNPPLRVLEPVAHSGSEQSGIISSENLESFEELDSVEAIDPLLEKIARSGMGSLTAKERRQLQHVREVLLRRENPRR
ncbi:MAG: hypothetical protein RLZZ399_2806 [Verrucomicrobiota bacterium]